VLVPVKRQANGIPLDDDNRTSSHLLTRLRASANAPWPCSNQREALQRIRLNPSRIGDIVRACLVLTHFEGGPRPGRATAARPLAEGGSGTGFLGLRG
jgi:hypothetical protein